MASKLYVGWLSYSTTSERPRGYFAQCRTAESATVVPDRFAGQSRGFGFVKMSPPADAQRGDRQAQRTAVRRAKAADQRGQGGERRRPTSLDALVARRMAGCAAGAHRGCSDATFL